MDPKQKNLSPELKAIYDRVMNTKITSRPQEVTPAIPGEGTQKPAQEQPVAPSQPPVHTPMLRTEVIESHEAPPPSQPTVEPAPIQTKPVMPQETAPQSAKSSVDLSPIEPENGTSQGFLSSLPPRPLNSLSQEPFVFTAGKTEQPKNDKTQTLEQPAEKAPSTSGGKISSKIIIGLLVVFLGVYSLFWAKMFGLF